MKNLLYSVILILLTSLSACQRSSYPHTMQQAESVMNTRPDSALNLLQSMADSLTMLPEEAQMYYHLLTIQAKDKQYITHTSDSLINRIVKFYEDYGDKERLMLAYYYQGRVYRDMNDAPRALQAFQLAENIKCPNVELLTKVYSQMGYLYINQGLFDEAIRINKKALDVFKYSKRENKAYFALRDIAKGYEAKNMKDSTLYYYGECLKISKLNNDSIKYQSILAEQGRVFYNMGQTDKAKNILIHLWHNTTRKDKSHIDLTLGYIYKEQELWDSAYFHFNQVLLSDNNYKRYYSYKNLFDIECVNNNYSQASKFAKEALSVKENIEQATQTEAIAKINALYNYQHIEEKNNVLKLQNERKQSQIYLLALAFLLALFIVFICFVYAKKKKLEVLIQAEKFRKHNALQQALNTANIKKNEEQISQLETDLRSLQTQKDTLHLQLLTTQKELLELTNKHCEAVQKKRKIQDTIFCETAICKHFRQAEMGKVEITGKDWDTLRNTIEAYYPLFTKNLKELCPSISDREFRICLMIKATISVKGISNILKCDSTAISKTRKRLHAKITGTKGNSKDLDKILIDL